MAIVLAVDLGTSGIKISLFEENRLLQNESETYAVITKNIYYAEQDPEEWWSAFVRCVKRIRMKFPNELNHVAVIGLSGQMHGLVCVDKSLKVLRPAIIWLDSRSAGEIQKLKRTDVYQKVVSRSLNQPSPGFAFPSLLWMREKETAAYEAIYKIMHPKDYLRLRLSGKVFTDESDASASGIFDTINRTWQYEEMEELGICTEIFPEVKNAFAVFAELSQEGAEETGLKKGIPIATGAGDQPCYCLGNGLINSEKLSLNIGSSGQVSVFSKLPVFDSEFRTQTFCHAMKEAYSVFGATLCAGMTLNWAKHKLFHGLEYAQMDALAMKVEACSEGLLFLPYLCGERSPIMDSQAKAIFYGMRLRHGREHMLRAMMEGVVFSLFHSYEVLHEMGFDADYIISSGAGAKSDLWVQMQADIFNKPIYRVKLQEQAAVGAAIIAGVGIGIWKDVETACKELVCYEDCQVLPNNSFHQRYYEAFQKYKQLYSNTKELNGFLE